MIEVGDSGVKSFISRASQFNVLGYVLPESQEPGGQAHDMGDNMLLTIAPLHPPTTAKVA